MGQVEIKKNSTILYDSSKIFENVSYSIIFAYRIISRSTIFFLFKSLPHREKNLYSAGMSNF